MMALELSPINALSYQILRSNYAVLDIDHPTTSTGDLAFIWGWERGCH